MSVFITFEPVKAGLHQKKTMYEKAFHKADLSQFSFLVTGGAGFIGSHLVEYLLKYGAKKVRVLDNLSTGSLENVEIFKADKAYEFVKGDITSYADCESAVKTIDYVLHEAALGSVPRSIKNPLATHNANATGFINILEAVRQSSVRRIVFASSSSVYGDNEATPKVEANIGNPISPYAASKQSNELYAKAFSNVYPMEIIGLRYFNIFGPRQNPNGAYAAAIPLFINSLLKKEAVYINGDGEQSRDFTFVENAVQANIKALFAQNDACGKIFNAACGASTSVNDLFNMIAEQLNASQKANHREERIGDVRNSLADISLAKSFLDYEPEVQIEEGIRRTVDWYKSALV